MTRTSNQATSGNGAIKIRLRGVRIPRAGPEPQCLAKPGQAL